METMALRQALLTRLGRFPQRVPLTPTVGSRIDEGAYTRALVTYDVEAGERVSAWLLMPQGTAPPDGWPAVLAIHQHDNHYDLGKAEPAGLAGNAMYAYGKELCQRGYVVLCPDLLCFEDRRPAYEVRQANRHWTMLAMNASSLPGACWLAPACRRSISTISRAQWTCSPPFQESIGSAWE